MTPGVGTSALSPGTLDSDALKLLAGALRGPLPLPLRPLAGPLCRAEVRCLRAHEPFDRLGAGQPTAADAGALKAEARSVGAADALHDPAEDRTGVDPPL